MADLQVFQPLFGYHTFFPVLENIYVLGLERGLIQTVNLVVERMVDSWFHLHDLENVGFKVLMWNSNRFVWEYV